MASSACKTPLRAIGIDFGTTNTVVALKDADGAVHVLEIDPLSKDEEADAAAEGRENARDPRLLKTLLFFASRRESFFGSQAIAQYFDRGMEGRFFQSIKRLLPNPDFTGTSLFGAHADLESLITRILAEVKKRIEAAVGPIDDVPIAFGRPARYSQDPGREGLAVVRFKRAIGNAGFSKYRLVEEPTAAAAVGALRAKAGETLLVADLGGGTSDFTLFEAREPGAPPHVFAVHGVSIAGDQLDSDFFVARLNPHFGSEIKYQRPFSSNVLTLPTTFVRSLPKWHHHAFLREKATWNFILSLRKELVDETQRPQLENLISLIDENLGYRLHQKVEGLKVALSGAPSTDFGFKSYPIDIGFPVARDDFEAMIDESVQGIDRTLLETFRIGKVETKALNRLIFTGGTSKVPKVRAALAAHFPGVEISDHETFTAVAEGLALLGDAP